MLQPLLTATRRFNAAPRAHRATPDECAAAASRLPQVPGWFWDLHQQASLCDLYLELTTPESHASPVFPHLLSPTDIIEEAFEFYPGIHLSPRGLIPIAGCATGSGNPFFCDLAANGPILQFDHAAPLESGPIPDGASWLVAENLLDLFTRAKVE